MATCCEVSGGDPREQATVPAAGARNTPNGAMCSLMAAPSDERERSAALCCRTGTASSNSLSTKFLAVGTARDQ